MSESRFSPLNWAVTPPAIAGVFASLLVHDVLQRVAIRVSSEVHQRVVSSMAHWVNAGARLAGTRFRAEGLENAAGGSSYIIVSNHQSTFDIAMTSDLLAHLRPRYVSKRSLAKGVPGVSYNLRRGGSALIDRKDPVQSRAAIADLARRMREGNFSVLIFPEGTRSRTGKMKPFRAGGLRELIANAPGVPVLPVTTSGGSKLFRHDMLPVVANVELVYRVHPPVMPPDPSDEEAFAKFVTDLHETIRAALPPDERDAP